MHTRKLSRYTYRNQVTRPLVNLRGVKGWRSLSSGGKMGSCEGSYGSTLDQSTRERCEIGGVMAASRVRFHDDTLMPTAASASDSRQHFPSFASPQEQPVLAKVY